MSDTSPPSLKRSTNRNTQSKDARFTIPKQSADSWTGRLWDQRWRSGLAVFVLLSALPFLCFVVIGVVQGTLWLPGEANGIFEDPIFLSYFPVAFFGVMGVRHALERQYDTLNSLHKNRVLRFEEDTGYLTGEYADYSATLTATNFRDLIDFYEFLLAVFTFRGKNSEVSCPETYRSTYRNLRRLLFALSLGGLIALGIGTYYHWFALQTYGFDIWASSNYLVGFVARFVYEAVLYVFVVPYILIQLIVSLFLVYHPLKRLNETNGLQFRRYAPDEAGGLSQFGVQSFTNVLALMPFILPITMYTIFYPMTVFLLAGLVLYVFAVPLVFVGQLWSAHRAMSEMHDMELDIIGEALTQNYHLYKHRLVEADSMEELDDDTLVTHGEALEKADIVYDGIQKQSTWPFGRTQIGQVLSLMTFLIGIVVSLI